MIHSIPQDRLEEKLVALDASFDSEGLPLRFRCLEAFKRIYGSVPDGLQRTERFKAIWEWYFAKYDDLVRWDGVIARFPILVKGQVLFGIARFPVGDSTVEYTQDIEGLPPKIRAELQQTDFRAIAEAMLVANLSWRWLHNLSVDDLFLGKEERALTRRAMFDLENSARSVKDVGDTQSAIVQAHEAAEKFLKAAYAYAGGNRPLQEFGHDIPRLFRELAHLQKGRYAWLSEPIRALQQKSPNMQLRYKLVPRSVESAVSAYRSALHICGTIANMWVNDHLRGSAESDFVETKFYTNGTGSTFYCKGVDASHATLILFKTHPTLGSQMMDVRLALAQSALYIEVADPLEDARLRQNLVHLLRNPGGAATEKEVGLRRVVCAEGSYITSLRSILVGGDGGNGRKP